MIEQEQFRDIYHLFLERNDQTINNYNAIIILATLANMDIQAVLTESACDKYMTKYITKHDAFDIFRDLRDNTGKPAADAFLGFDGQLSPETIRKITNKAFMDQIKFTVHSLPEVCHHALNLPGFFSSRTFLRVSLAPGLHKLNSPEEVAAQKEPVLTKLSELDKYEERCQCRLSEPSLQAGYTNEMIKAMSLFQFTRTFIVREHLVCLRTKPPIIIFAPYVSAKKRKNPRYHEYIQLTLMAYKAYLNRSELQLEDAELEKTFHEFLNGKSCPNFVKQIHNKANPPEFKDNPDIEDDEDDDSDKPDEAQRIIEELEANFNFQLSDDDDDNYVPQPSAEDNVNIPDPFANDPLDSQFIEEHTVQPPNKPAPIAKFTHAYQEYGHMAPKGMELDADDDVDVYDDDNDVNEEVRLLSFEPQLIFHLNQQTWDPKHPENLFMWLRKRQKLSTLPRTLTLRAGH